MVFPTSSSMVFPKKVESGTTEIIQNNEDGTFSVKHVTPEGEIKEIKFSPKPFVFTQDSESSTPSSVETTSFQSEDTTTVLPVDQVEKISFDDFEKEVPNVSEYYIKDGVPYFVISDKPTKIESGLTEVKPNSEDGSIKIIHTYPDGGVKEITLSAQPLQTTQGFSTTVSLGETTPSSDAVVTTTVSQDAVTTTLSEGLILEDDEIEDIPELISFDNLVKELPKISKYYIHRGIPYFVIKNKPHRVESGVTQVKPNDDGTLSIVNISPDGIVKEAQITTDQLKKDDAIDEERPEMISFEDLVKTLTKITRYYIKDGIPYFVINHKPYRVESGETRVIPNKDGTVAITNISPDWTVREAKIPSGQLKEEEVVRIVRPTTITFENLVKELPKVNSYYIRMGIPYFIINNQPHRVESGVTQVTPNDDGTISIVNIRPDGSVKEAKVSSDRLTENTQTTTGSPIASESTTPNSVFTDEFRNEKVKEISFDDFEKEVPNVSEYYIKDGVPYFVINNKPTRIESGLTEVTPNSEDGSIKVTHTYPDGGVKEIILSAQPIQTTQGISTTVSLGETTPSSDAVVTTTVSQDAVTTTLSEGLILEDDEIEDIPELISFDNLVKELPKISKYYIHRGIPYFVINNKPHRVESGVTQVKPNDDGTLSIVNISPDSSVKEAKVPSDQLTEETLTTTGSPNASEFTTPNSVYSNQVSTDQVQEISFEDFEKEVPNVSEYYIKDGVPYFVINDKPTKIESGLTEVTPNNEDESIKVTHTYPDGGVKEIILSAQPIQTTQGISTTVSLGETTPSSDAVVTTTVSQDAVTTTLSEGLILEDDEIEDIPELISFEDLVKELPKISKYYIHRGIPYFVINNKPHRVESGVTQVKPNDDGTLSIVNISPDGSVKEAKVSSDQLTEKPLTTTGSPIASEFTTPNSVYSNQVSTDQVQEISFEDFEKEVPNVSEYYIKDGVPYFVINDKPTKIESGLTEVTPNNEDESIKVTHTYPDGGVKEIILSAQPIQTTQGISTTVSLGETTPSSDAVVTTTISQYTTTLSEGLISEDDKPELISFADLVKELPKISKYYIHRGIPYFIINNIPHRVESGVTQVTPNDDGTLSIVNISPDGSVKEAKVSSDQLTEKTLTTTSSPIASESTTTFKTVDYVTTDKNGIITNEFENKTSDAKPTNQISFEELEEQLSNVTGYFVKDNVTHFVIDGKPMQIESGETSVVPNEEDGSLTITNVNPDGTVKAITLSAEPINEDSITTSPSSILISDTTKTPESIEEISTEQGVGETKTTPSSIVTTMASGLIEEISTEQGVGQTTTTQSSVDTTKSSGSETSTTVKESIVLEDDVDDSEATSPSSTLISNATKYPEAIEEMSTEQGVGETTTTPSSFKTTLSSGLIEEISTEQGVDESTTTLSSVDTTKAFGSETSTTVKESIVFEDDVEDSLTTSPSSTLISSTTKNPESIEEFSTQQGVGDTTTTPSTFKTTLASGLIEKISTKQEVGESTTTLSSDDTTKASDSITSTTLKESIIFEDDVEDTVTTKSVVDKFDFTKKFETTVKPVEGSSSKITFEDLKKELPNVSEYYVKDDVPYFVVDGIPRVVDSGVTKAQRDEKDGSVKITHFSPEGQVSEIVLSNQPIDKTNELATEKPKVITTTTKSSFVLADSEGTTTSLGASLNNFAEDITITDFEKEIPNIEKYYKDENVPYFIIDGVPRKIKDGETNVVPNLIDGTFVVNHITPNGEIKQFNVNPDQNKENNKTTEVPSILETTTLNEDSSFTVVEEFDKNSSVVKTTQTPYESTTVSDESNIIFPDQTTTSSSMMDMEFISFDDLVKEIPYITEYFIKDDVPFFIISGKPRKIKSGKTQAIPDNEDGSINVVHMTTEGDIKEIKVYASNVGSTATDTSTVQTKTTESYTNLEETTVDPSFVTKSVEFTSTQSPKSDIQEDDSELDKTTTGQPIEEIVEGISIEELEKELPNIEKYITKNGIPYFFFNGVPKKVESGITEIIPNNEDGTFSVKHVTPEGEIKEIKFSPKPFVFTQDSESSTPSSVETTSFQSEDTTTVLPVDQVEKISFDDFEKEVPNVSEYYIKDGVPYFVINDKPTRIESGLTEVTPNSEDGSIKIIHRYPDGGVKEITLSAQPLQTTQGISTTVSLGETTPSSDAVVTTTVSQDAVTTTLSEGLILEDDEIEDIPELISFDNLVKELPKITKYYIHRGIPYFVINNKPHRVESGVTQVTPNDDETLSIVNISPDGSVKEAKVPSDQLTEETLTTTGSPNASEFTTPNSVYSNQVSTDQVQEISFEDFEKEVPNVSEYYIKDGVPYFVINDKPTKIESGLTEVTPNNEDESIKVTHTYPDGGVKEIILYAQPIQTTQGISTTVSLGETTPSSDAVVTTTISQYTTTLSEGLISEDDKPELISFADLVKELPKVSQYYIHRGIPYFIINSKPHRVESGVTQVKPNDDGTLSIVNISPEGSVKEAKVSSDQLTEKL
nr:mucin-12-like [Lepeophtheirus salmonis]